MNRTRLLVIGIVALVLGAVLSSFVYQNLQAKMALQKVGVDVVVAANDIVCVTSHVRYAVTPRLRCGSDARFLSDRCGAVSPWKENDRNQAISQACAVSSPVSWGFERNRDVTPTKSYGVTSKTDPKVV
jgi:hypothetical protein